VRSIWFLTGPAWVICGVVAYSGSCGYWDYQCHTRYRESCDEDRARHLTGSSMFSGVLGPVGVVMGLIPTGFYQHGFRLSVRPGVDTSVRDERRSR